MFPIKEEFLCEHLGPCPDWVCPVDAPEYFSLPSQIQNWTRQIQNTLLQIQNIPNTKMHQCNNHIQKFHPSRLIGFVQCMHQSITVNSHKYNYTLPNTNTPNSKGSFMCSVIADGKGGKKHRKVCKTALVGKEMLYLKTDFI